MEDILSNQSGVEIQLGLFESIIDLLLINPICLLGIILIGISLVVIFRKNNKISKIKVTIFSLIMYYYLCLLFTNIVGIPTLSEYMRLSRLGEAFFNPNINLIPFSDGFSFSFILNILLFIPLGFFCPAISRTYERAKVTFFIGLGLSSFIEISQLFTLHRATDINDVLTNIAGTMIGYLCFRMITKLRLVNLFFNPQVDGKDYSINLPIITIAVAFVLVFFS